MKTLERLQILEKKTIKRKSFQVFILESKAPKNSYNGKILGLTLAEWVKFATNNIPQKIIKFDDKVSVLEVVKDYISRAFDYTIVLLGKTPLISQDTVMEIMEYCEYKDVQMCKLPVGYVINNKSFLNQNNCTIDSVYSQHMEEFYIVETKAQYNHAYEVLRDRINAFHIDNGVEFVSPNVYIEPFVDIESGVIIYPNNSLKGKTIISSGVILKENNVIEDSKVGQNSCISGSVITSSIIDSNVYVSPHCTINNSMIGSNCTIGSNSSINNYNVNSDTKLAPNSILGDTNDSSSRPR